jgi:hypothetical protein
VEEAQAPAGTGGQKLSAKAVSELPLNKRDFSQLLLLAAGTMTDTNGAANFTQQFAVNGQRGTAAVFAMDGADSSDPEMGGATFTNFNVDAVEEIRSSSGWMPAEIGRGAAGFTDIVTRSGTNDVHGSVFEFLRNAALDARNFFDERSIAQPRRIPPFIRNEFGLTNGGPVVIPGLYNGRNRTFYFAEYQGFRQVLSDTEVIPVPSAAERSGLDTTAFPGDTLIVPVDPRIAKILARYPLPNDPEGPYGARTFATASKVTTVSDQFSLRIDHHISDQSRLFGRFTMANVTGPTTNPSQTALDPEFAVGFLDRQRNAAIAYTRTPSPTFTMESGISFTRTTPSFPTFDRTDPALSFGDGSYEAFNAAAGSVMGPTATCFRFARASSGSAESTPSRPAAKYAGTATPPCSESAPTARTSSAAEPPMPRSPSARPAACTTSPSAIRCRTRSPACSAPARLLIRKRSRRPCSRKAPASAIPPSIATPTTSTSRTPGRYRIGSR